MVLNLGFMSTIASCVKKKASDREIRQAFMVFDRDNDGVISPNELRFVMDIIGEPLSDEQLNAVMKEADFDGDGAITCTYFRAVQILLMGWEIADRLKKIEISVSLSGLDKRRYCVHAREILCLRL